MPECPNNIDCHKEFTKIWNILGKLSDLPEKVEKISTGLNDIKITINRWLGIATGFSLFLQFAIHKGWL